MRKLLENWITAVVALATLALSVIWFLKNKEIEPLIGIITSAGIVLAALVARLYPEKKEDPQPTFISKSEKNTVKKSTLTARSIHIGDVHQYADRKIPRNLTAPPFDPPIFLGRTTELQQVHDRLFAGENFLMLVNGQGGIGKTSFAAKYWDRFHIEYQHRAFLYVGDGIADAMLSIAPALGVVFPETMATAQRLQTLLQAIGNLESPCLIVLDNANDRKDLDAHYQLLRRCTNCHLLITSRLTEFRETAPFPIGVLPEGLPLALFRAHYPAHRPADDPIFWGIFKAVGGNTLVVEILAKNLKDINANKEYYPLEKLLHDLQSRGLLRLTKQANVQVNWQSFEKSKPEDIIAAMYDLRPLDAASLALLSAFAVLPPENIAYDTLEALLAPDDPRPFSETLTALNQTGWIERNAPAVGAVQYKCSPVVQEVVRAKSEDLLTLCRPLIDALIEKTDQDVLHIDDYRPATLYTRYAESLVAAFDQNNDEDLGRLCENVGNFYTTTGDLGKAADVFQKMADICAALAEGSPNNPDFRNNLAISYEKLGITETSLGNLGKALTYFESYNQLEEELYYNYPTKIEFKNNLAVSYQFLGNMQSSLGNLDKALIYYEAYNHLANELYTSFPTNLSIKHTLAVSYTKLGETQASLGNLDKGLTYYQRDIELTKELYNSYPKNVEFKNGIVVTYTKIGEIHFSLGNLDKALAYYEDSHGFAIELNGAYPTNVAFKNNLAISYSKLGEIQVSLGKFDKAFIYFEKRLQLGEELLVSNPTNVSFKHGMAISYSKLGDVHVSQGNLNKALIYYESVLVLMKSLYAAYPINALFKNGLAISYQNLGNIQTLLENLDKALICYEAYNKLEKELCAAYSTNVLFKNNLAVSYSKLGETHALLKNLDKALFCFEFDTKLLEELNIAFPINIEYKGNLAVSYYKLGEFSRDYKNDQANARRCFQQAEALWLELVRDAPQFVQFQRFAAQVRRDLDALA